MLVEIHTMHECKCGANSVNGDVFSYEVTVTHELVVICEKCKRQDYIE